MAATVASAPPQAPATPTVFLHRAEIEHPPTGHFIEVDGVLLHYVEMGAGEPVVLLHGNGSMIQDFGSSGILERASKTFRVIAFDRPGFGFSSRPDGRDWTPSAQATLFRSAFQRLDIAKPIVVGHSWGAFVALSLALDHPDEVARLVLLSGYYFPDQRVDSFFATGATTPFLDDLIHATVAPLFGHVIMSSAIDHMFHPHGVSPAFQAAFPVALALRPSQLKAVAHESSMMHAAATSLSTRYEELRVPVVIIAGADDRIVDTHAQSARLHKTLLGSRFDRVSGAGHMIHHAAPDRVIDALFG
jgi:pimeloyl-ACP methyl ester carboxylesterase